MTGRGGRRRRRWPVPRSATGLLLVLAGCGGGDGGGTGPDGPGGVLTEDEQRAVTVNLVLTDFPDAGWQRRPARIDVRGDEDDRRFAACMDRPPGEDLRTALADSDSFTGPGGEQVTSTVQVLREEAAAAADFQALAGDRAVGCMQERLDRQYERDLGRAPDPARRTTARAPAPPGVEGEVRGFRYVVDGDPRLVVENYFVRVGRFEIAAGFVGRAPPDATGLVAPLLRKMAARAA